MLIIVDLEGDLHALMEPLLLTLQCKHHIVKYYTTLRNWVIFRGNPKYSIRDVVVAHYVNYEGVVQVM